ncbi:ABC transporter permease [uncultured Microbulbifer sp.]|uniref:ABC transporter permease n=1 Tax=uncultured Microbulbifer sp. TaxID=348147 RepID=UPI002635D857|nr:ABC transporter permease [uncultured Microbulbifer sp.]
MLFRLRESLRAALHAILNQGFRSFLTVLSIVISVASVITIIALMQGFGVQLSEQFKGLGTNTLTITPYTPFKEALQGKKSRLTHDDMIQIQHRVDGISHATPLLNISAFFQGKVRYKASNTLTQIYGTTRNYESLYESYPQYGRFFTPTDDRSRRQICVIGAKVRDDLELPENPVGEFLQIGSQWFKIVGVMEERGELLGFNQDDYVLLPYRTARSATGGALEASIDSIVLKVDDLNQLPLVKERVRRVLRIHHGLRAEVDDDFKVSTAEQLMDSVSSITDMLTMVLGGIVSISLLVGGIGIMNIMLVSVVERTKEIGICKSLGAKRSDILLQFLLEGFLLSFLGGVLGVALGFGLAELVILIVPVLSSVSIPLWAVLLSVWFSGVIGIVFGIIPASKAANLDPIEALRYE